MKHAWALGLILLALSPGRTNAQSAPDEGDEWEIAALATWAASNARANAAGGLDVFGLEVRRSFEEHLGSWLSVRRFGVTTSCLDIVAPGGGSGGEACTPAGWGIQAGLKLLPAGVRTLTPYLTLGAGVLDWEDADVDAAWSARAGLSFGLGPIRPRVEYGWERFVGRGFTVGVGVTF